MSTYLSVRNHEPVKLGDIPQLTYNAAYAALEDELKNGDHHLVAHFAREVSGGLEVISALAVDYDGTIRLRRFQIPKGTQSLPSLSKTHFPVHTYEREIHERWGIDFEGHPWLKPIRFPHDRADLTKGMNEYPFLEIDGNEIHEVGVGPIHAGIIEPGHFRFLCDGERILHLEIHNGYQHRGVEKLFLEKKRWDQRLILSESITGDTVCGHGLAFTLGMEAMGGLTSAKDQRLILERTIALELERIAVHTGDLSGMCVDVAYQLGAEVINVLRTPIINYMQLWCGNRFAKGYLGLGGSHYPLTTKLKDQFRAMLDNYDDRFAAIMDRLFTLSSVLTRFRKIGVLTGTQAELIGAVGMVARFAGLDRDVRRTHSFLAYEQTPYEYFTLFTGDVYARALIRKMEIERSILYIRALLAQHDALGEGSLPAPTKEVKLPADTLCLSLTEGWRGEICHVAITDSKGELETYKIKDPSFHNWMGLALACRNQEISDFPICNKSFDQSYCGVDL